MLIGLLSDTHDRVKELSTAMTLLRAAGAEFYIHAGDVGGEQILRAFAGERAAFVFGNNDLDRQALSRYADRIGVQCLNTFGTLELGGKSFAVTHGDDSAIIKRVLGDAQNDFLITGHTHVRRDERVGRVRWINPGALYRARPKTVATLETETGLLKSIVVDPDP